MTKVVFATCLLVAFSLAGGRASARDPTQLLLHKGARVGIVNMMDAEITHFHTSKVLAQSFLKTQLVNWQVESMLNDAVTPRVTQLGLVAVPLGPSDSLLRNRDESFVNNSVAKGLPREIAREFASLAASEHLDGLIVLAPGLNNAAQASGAVRRGLPDYLRGWGFITDDANSKPQLFNMTQVLLIGITGDTSQLNAREWGGGYADEWADYVPPENPKLVPLEQLDKLQPLFGRILGKQAGRAMDFITVTP
jgi:hypothetical protein